METRTARILDLFQQINQIPRCSKQEQKISEWLCGWAEQRHLEYEQDPAGNVVIRIPASPGKASAPPVVIQGHMDMVCEKQPDIDHDFQNDPIENIVDGEWLRANGTTLGADNGIALAIALVFAEDADIIRPALELLFTVDEETGLNGAKKLAPDFIRGRILLNVDSEDEGVFTVGCAGGKDSEIKKNFSATGGFPQGALYRLTAGGMRGGHSGVDIHKTRANAIRVLARWMDRVHSIAPFRLIELEGGKALNAIPREARATISLEEAGITVLNDATGVFQKELEIEYGATEPSIQLSVGDAGGKDPAKKGLGTKDTRHAIDLLLALPHGVYAMSKDIQGLVETSSNLATVRLEESLLKIGMSQRSSIDSRLAAITAQIEAMARISGAEVRIGNGYPSWMPDLSSPLLQRCKDAYRKRFGKDPEIEAVHAGLECGVIGANYPGMDMISFGPTLKNPHSPEEKLHIPSIGRLWDFMSALMEDLAEG